MEAPAVPQARRKTFRNPVIAGDPGTDHGDPFVIKHLDAFYLYHSGETAGRRGISVHRSSNLVDWEFQGYALEPAESGWAWSDLWAPEVVYERGTFYMYFSATRKRAPGRPATQWQQGEGDDGARRLGIARATSPAGPFVPDEQPLLDSWSIDGHPFRDDDGTMWLFYNTLTEELGIDALRGTGTVCDRLVAPDRLAGHPTPVTLPSERWEGVPTGDWYWNEAPYVLKRRGRYYQMYSGGAFSDPTYGIGLAEAPGVRGPWQKHPDNPVVRSRGRILGPGHHSFVFGPDAATPYAVYHGYVEGDAGRKVHIDRLFWVGDRPHIAGPTDGDQELPPGGVFERDIPHWRAETWVKGSWVEVGGTRFGLVPGDVWHQVEVNQSDWRFAVRVGGVLRASQPGIPAAGMFRSDGDVACTTLTSSLEDGGLHDLPAGSSYAWRWGGRGRLELTAAVKGTVEVAFDGATHVLRGDREQFRLVRLDDDGPSEKIVVTANGDGATVTDVTVRARA